MELTVFLVFSLLVHGAFGNNGEIVCEDLLVGMCAYSVASSGNRCSLETYESSEGTTGYQCKTLEVVVADNGIANLIESDECISACGADRNSVGISSDSLLESTFTSKLCSQECYQNCPNIIDLYYNLALGEGVYLPAFCMGRKLNGRREMSQIQSSGVAWAPSTTSDRYGRQLSEGPAASAALTFDNSEAAAPW
ncbi:uncharacterized protein LOC132051187 [Lycium ferocissimum]|uniref:uncharacterized protein LOC132051187 n=1 Tax=Lycium ferocissimum TaxID=112874 RepID=UPI0028156D05|nr:uncharacterized protein LOC132051187 [Lycium ferocissimum]